MAASKAISGARVRFKVGGNVVGYAGGVAGSERVDMEPMTTLDYIRVREYVPVEYITSFTARIFRLVNQSLKQMGIFPQIDNILTSGNLVAAVEDRLTGNTLALWHEAKCTENNFDFEPRGLVQYNTSWVATQMSDESTITLGG